MIFFALAMGCSEHRQDHEPSGPGLGEADAGGDGIDGGGGDGNDGGGDGDADTDSETDTGTGNEGADGGESADAGGDEDTDSESESSSDDEEDAGLHVSMDGGASVDAGFQIIPGVFALETDIAYGPGELQQLDVIVGLGVKDAPVVVVVHGGGSKLGDKADCYRFGVYFARRGYMAVIPNYRLVPDGGVFPAPVNDVACAVAWAARNAESYGGDGSRAALFGYSSGSHLGAMVAYDEERDWLAECALLDGGTGSEVAGFIGMAGAYDYDIMDELQLEMRVKPFLGELFDAGLWDEAEPINFANAGDPPALLIHGEKDALCPACGSVHMGAALRDAGVDAKVVIVSEAGHNDIRKVFFSDDAVQVATKTFLAKHLPTPVGGKR